MMTLMNYWSQHQFNFHENSTGVLDKKTLSKMAMPRCGVADIINGTNFMMRSGEKNHHHSNSSGGPLHTVAHYNFFPRRQRWPVRQTHLTYAFLSGTRSNAMEPVARAFRTWQARTRFTFSRVQDPRTADLTIGFGNGDHGDGSPFDGASGTIAHAFAPTDGRFHYDADEQWAMGATQGAFDLETVALHEIGHLLGLGHSQVVCILPSLLESPRVCIAMILMVLGTYIRPESNSRLNELNTKIKIWETRNKVNMFSS